jgi:hypothetical protein
MGESGGELPFVISRRMPVAPSRTIAFFADRTFLAPY